jgi:hypothetical protein
MKTYPAYPETEAEINPVTAAGIRSSIRDLDRFGSHFAGYWCCELHDIDGSPIPHRYTAHTLFLIERDVAQCQAELAEA